MRRFALIATACLATACVHVTTDPVTGRRDVDVEQPGKKGEDWTATLQQQGGSGVTGTLTAAVLSGTTNATLTVNGAAPGASHPWHIHNGTCATGGGIVGQPDAYPPLVIGDQGSGRASVQLQLQLNEAQRYHVNVHASASDMATIVACGDLKN
ncbi:MAG TPA: hypothetical protein VF048_11710 [Gemmatimonadaceae bacterium]|jgi:hypothetical protein